MGNLTWMIKEWIRKLVPLAIAGFLAYTGFNLYNEGAFRHGIKPGITRALYKVPYFGSRFRHYNRSNSVVAQKRHVTKRKGHRYHPRGKKHHSRSRRRHR